MNRKYVLSSRHIVPATRPAVGIAGGTHRTLVLAALFVAMLAAPAAAQQRTIELSSVATADGFASPVINPAAPAFGNAGGIGALLGYDESAFGNIQDGDAPDFSLFLNTRVLRNSEKSGASPSWILPKALSS